MPRSVPSASAAVRGAHHHAAVRGAHHHAADRAATHSCRRPGGKYAPSADRAGRFSTSSGCVSYFVASSSWRIDPIPVGANRSASRVLFVGARCSESSLQPLFFCSVASCSCCSPAGVPEGFVAWTGGQAAGGGFLGCDVVSDAVEPVGKGGGDVHDGGDHFLDVGFGPGVVGGSAPHLLAWSIRPHLLAWSIRRRDRQATAQACQQRRQPRLGTYDHPGGLTMIMPSVAVVIASTQ